MRDQQADPTGDWRGDMAIRKIEIELRDIRLVGLHRSLVLLDGKLLIDKGLLGNRLLLPIRGAAAVGDRGAQHREGRGVGRGRRLDGHWHLRAIR